MPMGFRELDANKIRDISGEAMGADGRLRILPAAWWAQTTPDERGLFGHRHGLYGFPTVELVDYLREVIAGRSAIEIGAGSGVLAQALGIPATDNFQQTMPKYQRVYNERVSPPVRYGPNVIEMHASRAVRHYKPDVVIGQWVTHKYDPARPEALGNEIGIDEEDVLRHCAEYVVIGNDQVHKVQSSKKIWARAHSIEHPDFVYSRKTNPTPDFIARWRGLKAFQVKRVIVRTRK